MEYSLAVWDKAPTAIPDQSGDYWHDHLFTVVSTQTFIRCQNSLNGLKPNGMSICMLRRSIFDLRVGALQ